jgi:hypothetical protein
MEHHGTIKFHSSSSPGPIKFHALSQGQILHFKTKPKRDMIHDWASFCFRGLFGIATKERSSRSKQHGEAIALPEVSCKTR